MALEPRTGDARPFPPTQRSAVLGVRDGDPVARARAFERLVVAYWRPAYKHVRLRWRRSPDEARDLVQGFFTDALDKRWFDAFDPARGRFRTFVRVCLDRFVAKEAQAERRQKRGGGARVESLDFEAVEDEIGRSEGAAADVEELFDAEWTRALFADALAALRLECEAAGKQVHGRIFERVSLDDEPPSYATLAAEHGLKITDVTNHLAWARRTFRRIVLERLRDLTASDDEWRAEARAILGRAP